MKDEHVVALLESAPLTSLGEAELAAVRAHVEGCGACRRAFRAAQISAQLVRERAAQEVEPPPFFQTRVLAALRERQAAAESPASVFRRLWKATGALVSGMAATVAALAVFTFVAPSAGSTPQDAATAFDAYSAEELILARGGASDDALSYDQVLTTVYETDDGEGR
ncbi:MAG TPA: hypothetical protein VGV38_23955 [Pyrinomonadaceae bacterium]|nr:hypothetical protein [Pyrinomonadaceae bacterium]